SPRSSFVVPPSSFPLEPERWPVIVRDAKVLLGRPHHLSIHPGGVVVTPQPIENYAPQQVAPTGVVMTQFDKDGVEYVGLVKIDLLGNRALATVDEAMAWLEEKPQRHRGTENAQREIGATSSHALCASSVPLCLCGLSSPLPDVLDLLQQGDTLGVN